jgi:TolA-binding protein
MKRFDIAWTPTFLFQDFGGKVHGKLVGYIPVDDFLAQLQFGKGMVFFEKERHEEAAKRFRMVIEKHPNAGAAPEAIFFLGVAEYKKTHEASALRRAYDTLTEKYPQSEWARRAQPYSAIPK